MSRKDFNMFAEEIRYSNLPIDERRRCAELIARACRQINPRFSNERFFAACGLND